MVIEIKREESHTGMRNNFLVISVRQCIFSFPMFQIPWSFLSLEIHPLLINCRGRISDKRVTNTLLIRWYNEVVRRWEAEHSQTAARRRYVIHKTQAPSLECSVLDICMQIPLLGSQPNACVQIYFSTLPNMKLSLTWHLPAAHTPYLVFYFFPLSAWLKKVRLVLWISSHPAKYRNYSHIPYVPEWWCFGDRLWE